MGPSVDVISARDEGAEEEKEEGEEEEEGEAYINITMDGRCERGGPPGQSRPAKCDGVCRATRGGLWKGASASVCD